VNAELLARLERPLDGAHAGTVTKAGRPAAATSPPAIAVHDDPDVTGDL
jgi:hypothetical protein